MRDNMVNRNREHSTIPPSRDREIYTSKDGFEFDIYTSHWQLDAKSSFNVGWLSGLLPQKQEEALRRAFAKRANLLSIATLRASSSRFKQFLIKFTDINKGISIDTLLRFYSSSEPKSIKSDVKVILECCLSEGYGWAFESGLGDYLSQLVIGDRGNRFQHEKNEDTRALTEYERKQFIYQLVRAHYTGKICAKTYLILKLVFITGKRPEQLASSKICDFQPGTINLDGTTRKVILYNCPVAKQKYQTFRAEFNEVPLSWELDFDKDIAAVANISIMSAEKILGKITPEQKRLVPLFCIDRPTKLVSTELEKLGCDMSLNSKVLHSSTYVRQLLNAAFEDSSIFSITSERTGKILHLTARRLRHTYATKQAMSGASIAEVANSLDHASYKAAMAYVNALPVLAIKIGEHLETTLSALAKRFDKNQVISIDTEKVIKLYTKHKSHDVGLCGKEVFCTEDYPIACYECELFIPSPFGNHKAVLNYVEDRIKEACEFGDFRGVENWRTIQIAVLERKFMADQVRLKMLSELPEVKGIQYEEEK